MEFFDTRKTQSPLLTALNATSNMDEEDNNLSETALKHLFDNVFELKKAFPTCWFSENGVDKLSDFDELPRRFDEDSIRQHNADAIAKGIKSVVSDHHINHLRLILCFLYFKSDTDWDFDFNNSKSWLSLTCMDFREFCEEASFNFSIDVFISEATIPLPSYSEATKLCNSHQREAAESVVEDSVPEVDPVIDEFNSDLVELFFGLDKLGQEDGHDIEVTFDSGSESVPSKGVYGSFECQILSQDLVRSQIVADWLQVSSLLSWLPKLVLYDQNQMILKLSETYSGRSTVGFDRHKLGSGTWSWMIMDSCSSDGEIFLPLQIFKFSAYTSNIQVGVLLESKALESTSYCRVGAHGFILALTFMEWRPTFRFLWSHSDPNISVSTSNTDLISLRIPQNTPTSNATKFGAILNEIGGDIDEIVKLNSLIFMFEFQSHIDAYISSYTRNTNLILHSIPKNTTISNAAKFHAIWRSSTDPMLDYGETIEFDCDLEFWSHIDHYISPPTCNADLILHRIPQNTPTSDAAKFGAILRPSSDPVVDHLETIECGCDLEATDWNFDSESDTTQCPCFFVGDMLIGTTEYLLESFNLALAAIAAGFKEKWKNFQVWNSESDSDFGLLPLNPNAGDSLSSCFALQFTDCCYCLDNSPSIHFRASNHWGVTDFRAKRLGLLTDGWTDRVLGPPIA